jgi:CDP-paratose 2-epimerase
MNTPSTRPLALVTGGAGFIGTNVADRLLRDGWRVRLFDNFSRAGVTRNVDWLRTRHVADPSRIEVSLGDVRDADAVRRVVEGTSRVFHFAAQVAVTTSLIDPSFDFAVNAGGTLHLLEALRALDRPPSLLFTSTNKVYGHLEDVPLRPTAQRYVPDDEDIARHGIAESRPLDFHSPYGCSKGVADQYVLDYARTFGLRATVFRMSCIYGPHQFGTEDQGWVAHFIIQALKRAPLTLYGDGRQIRDVLYVEDLVEAMMRAHDGIEDVSGQAFNIGGGSANTTSLLELIDLLGERFGERPAYALERWRRADQRYYVSDIGKFQRATGWTPRVPLVEGIDRLAAWFVGLRTDRRTTIAAQEVAS